MNKWIIITLCFCLAVSVTACSQRDDTNEPTMPQSKFNIQNSSTPSEQESPNESSDSSDAGESSEQSGISSMKMMV